MPKESFAENIIRLEQLIAGLQTKADEVPYLEAETTQLSALLASSKQLNTQQEQLSAQLQQATQQLDSKMDETLKLESKIRNVLKGKYGDQNEALEIFGVKPRRPRTRKTTTTPIEASGTT